MKMRTRRGFTVIDILVIIVIVAILAAILFAVLTRARANARSALCSDNMKNISRAMFMYAYDNDGNLPSHPQNLVWMRPLNKLYPDYVDSIVCPALPTPDKGRGFGFNLGLDSMPKSGRESKAFLWDGKDLKPGFVAPSAGWWMPDWLDYHRHNWRANICFLDGRVKPYPQPSPPYPGFQGTAIPASIF